MFLKEGKKVYSQSKKKKKKKKKQRKKVEEGTASTVPSSNQLNQEGINDTDIHSCGILKSKERTWRRHESFIYILYIFSTMYILLYKYKESASVKGRECCIGTLLTPRVFGFNVQFLSLIFAVYTTRLLTLFLLFLYSQVLS